MRVRAKRGNEGVQERPGCDWSETSGAGMGPIRNQDANLRKFLSVSKETRSVVFADSINAT